MSDHSSTESDEMTADNQNQRNFETDSINSVLGDFMGAREETFEELVNGFLYLKMDDLKQSTHLSVASSVNHISLPQARGGNQATATKSEERVVVSESLNTRTAGNTTNNNGNTEDLEEEVLQDDTACRQASEDALFRHRPASLTKFDNFVISEDDSADETDHSPHTGGDDKNGNKVDEDDNSWLPSSGYMASFAAGKSGSAATEQSTADSAEQQVASQTASQLNAKMSDSSDSSQPDSAIVSSVIKPSAPMFSQHGPTSETTNLECDESSSDCDAEPKPAVWSLNPGEVEEEGESTLPVTQGVNMMDFTMKVVSIADTAENAEGSAADSVEECSDEVVPFALDEDFDYDNVVYTPKFTQAEMAYLNSFVPKTS